MSAYVRVNPLDENVAPGERETIRAWAQLIYVDSRGDEGLQPNHPADVLKTAADATRLSDLLC